MRFSKFRIDDEGADELLAGAAGIVLLKLRFTQPAHYPDPIGLFFQQTEENVFGFGEPLFFQQAIGLPETLLRRRV
jgi:hypothetical protein